MIQTYILKLGFKNYNINIKILKIDGFIFKIFKIILANF